MKKRGITKKQRTIYTVLIILILTFLVVVYLYSDNFSKFNLAKKDISEGGKQILSQYIYITPPPNPGHGGEEVFININSQDLRLQDAITNGEFDSKFTGDASYSGIPPNQTHFGNEIIINVGGTITTLQEAINDDSLCNVISGTSPSEFGPITDQYQTGDEILIDFNGEKTLQQAINSEDFSACLTITVEELITIWNPTCRSGVDSYCLSGNEACSVYDYDECIIVEKAEVAKHSNGYDTFNVACNHVFGDGRNARPVLVVRCSKEVPKP